MSKSTGCRLMAPLITPCHALSPPEVLQPSEDVQQLAQRTKLRRNCVWHLASWNVRTLLDTVGPIETARQRCVGWDTEDRRIDQVIDVLEDYCVTVAALQETKWFGSEIYTVGKSIVLTAGRPVPRDDGQLGEGIALVLGGPAIYMHERQEAAGGSLGAPGLSLLPSEWAHTKTAGSMFSLAMPPRMHLVVRQRTPSTATYSKHYQKHHHLRPSSS